jgi:hypothetical protein
LAKGVIKRSQARVIFQVAQRKSAVAADVSLPCDHVFESNACGYGEGSIARGRI